MAKAALTGNDIIISTMGENPVVRDLAVALPKAPDISALNVDFDAALQQVKGVVDGLQNSWLLKYFPASLPNGLDPLLQQIMAGTIVTPAMQEILWERAKQQGMRDAARVQDEAVSQWASRGFSLPGGAINTTLNRTNQDLFFANADFAAQQAIKALDIQVDSVKFAAEIGTKLQLGLINGLTELVNAYSRLPASAAEYASAVANAKRAAYGAVSEYYRTYIESAGLSLRADEANADIQQRYLATAASFMGSTMSAHVSAVTSAVDSYARTAASTIGGLNNVTSIGIQSTTG
ncbi:MAG: hypothetical protein QFB87_05300 [Patescibacteria group bacterium]|nr:hypothetical protein [Patescibacteria group bacterium]